MHAPAPALDPAQTPAPNRAHTTSRPAGTLAPAPPPGVGVGPLERQRDFASVISRDAQRHDHDNANQSRSAAEDFVAIAFLEPLLAQLRQSNRAQPPFAPGPAEKQFGQLMDRVTARRLARASGFALVDRLERDLRRDPDRGAAAAARPPIDIDRTREGVLA